jgi:methylated-DNA-protein-cysteine methyltransferase-like protein
VTEFEDRVRGVVAGLQPGEVVSYGWVAGEAGRPGAHRAVGRVLRDLGDDSLPGWRVVRADAHLAAPNSVQQRRRLHAEGVHVEGDRIVDPPVRRT